MSFTKEREYQERLASKIDRGRLKIEWLYWGMQEEWKEEKENVVNVGMMREIK